ncbi:MAG: DNA polymerase III subunit beta, partial [Desulfovibrio sp.]|nr:DNA polymerase III subunit beta [Desulfovibrio sp.]
MKLKVQKATIIDGLIKAAAVLPSKAGAAYLRSIWLKAKGGTLSIMATDANIEFMGVYPADIEE